MKTLVGAFGFDEGMALNAEAVERCIRDTLAAGERIIRYGGCDGQQILEVARRLRQDGLPIIGIQCLDHPEDPPEYFIDGCSSVPVARSDLLANSAEATRMYQEWNAYGDPCGGSRWFNSVPKVELDVDYVVVWRCPITGCSGEMRYTGMDWPTGTPGHHHKCNSCGFTAAIKGAVFGEFVRD